MTASSISSSSETLAPTTSVMKSSFGLRRPLTLLLIVETRDMVTLMTNRDRQKIRFAGRSIGSPA
jgi:hypothetical protein